MTVTTLFRAAFSATDSAKCWLFVPKIAARNGQVLIDFRPLFGNDIKIGRLQKKKAKKMFFVIFLAKFPICDQLRIFDLSLQNMSQNRSMLGR